MSEIPDADAKAPLLAAWHERIDAATSAAEVVAAASEFVATLPRDELGRLPPPCRPPPSLAHSREVSAYAYDLVKHSCVHADAAPPLVHELADFFSRAAHRLSALAAPHHVTLRGEFNPRPRGKR